MMNRSLDRGLGRGSEPKRSMSPRGPPVCMSSMAQHARPNKRNHTLFERLQPRSELTTASTFVEITVPPSSAYLGEPQPLGEAMRFRGEAADTMFTPVLSRGASKLAHLRRARPTAVQPLDSHFGVIRASGNRSRR